ncbi:hypothetical protein ACF1BE_05740 [Streptomyces sp. NPDC014991]|uniref:hypothetical protein n=1 Tax=Streptomyces sp. NPDC014991 TaxID=3364935 RepID=UPI0036FE57CB
MDPAEHASDQLFVVDVPVSHVDHGFANASQTIGQDLSGLLDPLDVRTIRLIKLLALLVVAPWRAGRSQPVLQLRERLREGNALIVKVRCCRLEVGDLDVEYFAAVAHELPSPRPLIHPGIRP